MHHRPKTVVLLGLLVMATFAGFPAQIAWALDISFLDARTILSKMPPITFWLWVTAPVVGIGLVLFSRWAFLLAHIWFGYQTYSCLQLMDYRGILPFYAPYVGLLATAIAMATLWRPQVLRLFFSPQLQWWKTATRYFHPARVTITQGHLDRTFTAYNISSTGLFVKHFMDAAIGSTLSVQIRLDAHTVLAGKVEVVRRSAYQKAHPDGTGFRFLESDANMPRVIRRFFSKLNVDTRATRGFSA